MFTSTNPNYDVTSPEDPYYNCVAWTFDDKTKYWWPTPDLFFYWPSEVPRQVTVRAFIQLYQANGYVICDDHNLENGYEKVAIYVNNHQVPTHTAKQLSCGRWTSKLSDQEDVRHNSLEDLTILFGNVEVVLKRKTTLC